MSATLVARSDGEEIEAKALKIYQERLRASLDPAQHGSYLVIDVDTGHFEVDRNELAAMDRSRKANPSGRRYLMRIGYQAAHSMGGKAVAASWINA